MSIERSKEKDHKPLSTPKDGGKPARDIPSLRPSGMANDATISESKFSYEEKTDPRESLTETSGADFERSKSNVQAESFVSNSQAESKRAKKIKKGKKDQQMLSDERWLVRNGHLFTYFGLYLFSIMVLFRPYEIVPGLGFLSATAFYFGVVTLAFYFPSQLAIEGNLTMLSTEVKAILAMTVIALVTMPIARDPALAWTVFNDPFIKAVAIFIVLVNVVRTRKRLMGMLWLSFGIAVYLSFSALDLYMKGEFAVEDYRIKVNVGGMFGNPNEMAMHFVMMTPLVLTLGLAAKSKLMRVVYIGMTVMFVAANMVTYSRGGFLGLMVSGAVLAWKLGRKYRIKVSIASIMIGGIVMLAAPGNYGLRMLSIFIPGLDSVGSSDQRRELLERSLIVSARNPWGIGIGNFPIVGIRNLQSHNAFTQVSAELGILGLIAYLVFMISPFRKLSAIERSLFDKDKLDWYYYLAIGLQAGIIGYMVSSFFASVAYNWFIYYLIAYAVAFRRIYRIENEEQEKVKTQPVVERLAEAA